MKSRRFGIYANRHFLKKAMLAVACAALALCLAACGGGNSGKTSPSPSPSIEPTATPAPTVETVKVATVSEIDGPLNIRSEANTDSKILGEAYTGDKFEVLTENYTGLWHEISYNGGKAYVYAEFVTVSEMDKTALNAPTATADPNATADPSATAEPQATATPDPNAPITVNGSGRENTSTTSSDGVTAEGLRDTEDPERR